MQIVKPTHRFNNELMVESQPFDFSNPQFDPEEFTMVLAKTMVEVNGLGLSAIQVGVPIRIFCVRTDPIITCINPKIVDISGEFLLAEEGCLSFPGLFVKVKRHENVRLRFQTHDGKFVTRKFGGLAARVIQHEFDHLSGVLFYNRASRFHRDKELDRWERSLAKKSSALNNTKKELDETV